MRDGWTGAFDRGNISIVRFYILAAAQFSITFRQLHNLSTVHAAENEKSANATIHIWIGPKTDGPIFFASFDISFAHSLIGAKPRNERENNIATFSCCRNRNSERRVCMHRTSSQYICMCGQFSTFCVPISLKSKCGLFNHDQMRGFIYCWLFRSQIELSLECRQAKFFLGQHFSHALLYHKRNESDPTPATKDSYLVN